MKADAPVNLSNVASGCKMIPVDISETVRRVWAMASVTVVTAWVGWDPADRERELWCDAAVWNW